ncbi:MAG: GLUG motif-containing protein [Phycisphaerae bacterium]|jgi:hypothetical protein
MKKICTVICILVIASVSQAKYSGGTGEPNNPYLIAVPADLNAIGLHPEDWTMNFKLTADIDLSGYSYNIIGNQTNWFQGVFEGDNHKIRNLNINASGVKDMGLFGCVDSAAQIRNIILISVTIHNTGTCSATGALVGYNRGLISGCYSTGTNTVAADECTGGLIGYNDSGTISGCSFDADNVCGGGYTGGLLGYNNSGELTGCFSTGNVTGTGSIGGLVGMTWNGSISNCGANTSVTQVCSFGCFYAGGLVGRNYYGTIKNCWAEGNVTGSTVFGGLVGENFGGEISDCRACGDVIGNNSNALGGFAGVNQLGTISRCYAKGNAVSNGNEVGGFAGQNVNNSSIRDCYAIGDANGNTQVGGLAGISDSDSVIINSYSSGSVSGNSGAGGFIGTGNSLPGLYSECFWYADVNPLLSGVGNLSPDPAGVRGLSSVYWYNQRMFYKWDFINVWNIGEGQTFPFLRKYNIGDLNYDRRVNMFDFAVFAENWMEE